MCVCVCVCVCVCACFVLFRGRGWLLLTINCEIVSDMKKGLIEKLNDVHSNRLAVLNNNSHL